TVHWHATTPLRPGWRTAPTRSEYSCIPPSIEPVSARFRIRRKRASSRRGCRPTLDKEHEADEDLLRRQPFLQALQVQDQLRQGASVSSLPPRTTINFKLLYVIVMTNRRNGKPAGADSSDYSYGIIVFSGTGTRS